MGFGCEAAYAASNFALNVLHAKELVAHCDAANFASRRIMEKLGMELVSTQPGRRNRLASKESQEALYRLSVPALQDGILGKIVSGHIDRPFGSRHPRHPDMIYPVNYGYADDISAPDGDNQDVYLMGCDHPVCTFSGKVIAVYHRFNDIEDKWIVSADDQPHTNEEILESIRFQEQYFVGVLLR